MSNVLVAYFSASGTTKRIALELSNRIQADSFEIKPKIPYSSDDLNWMDSNSRSSIEMKDYKSRPAISSKVDNMEVYDVVFIGFPIWWYTAPTIIKTFLESYDFSKKTIIPFATSGGSGMGKIPQTLQEIVPEAKVKEGKLINHKIDYKKWVENYL